MHQQLWVTNTVSCVYSVETRNAFGEISFTVYVNLHSSFFVNIFVSMRTCTIFTDYVEAV